MDRTIFTKAISNKALHGAYLLEGVEENIKQAAVAAARKAILPEGLEQLNETTMENPDTSALIAACETMPFMSDQRLVIVHEHSALMRGEADEQLIDYIPRVPDTTVLLFIQRGKADARKKLYKAIDKQKTVVSFNTLSENELNDWICARFQKAGRSCSRQVAALISFTAGSDTMQLRTELEKLVDYTEERTEITEDDVRTVVTRSADYNAFQLVDLVVGGQESKALALLREMLVSGEERLGILAKLLRQYRILQHIKIMQYEKKSQKQMQEYLGIPGFALDRSIRQAHGLTGGQVKEAVALCLDTEYRIKSGELNQEGAVEACVLKLLTMRHPRT